MFPKLQEVDPRANSHSRNIASESDLFPTLETVGERLTVRHQAQGFSVLVLKKQEGKRVGFLGMGAL